jgi:hypothetical protein
MPSKVMLFDDNGATSDGIKRSISSIFAPTGQHQNNLDQPSRDINIRRLTATVRKDMFSSDIISSTRLFGYVFCAICSGLLFLSALLFRYRDKPNSNYVVHWKVNGAIVFGAVGCGIMFFIISCHVWFLPYYWLQVYRDGSKKERNIIISFIAYWCVVLWTCTGVFSVGSAQANVFVSTWLAFFALLNNYNEWRIAAVSAVYILNKKLPGFCFIFSHYVYSVQGHSSFQEWSRCGSHRYRHILVYMAFSSLIALASVLDTYINTIIYRDESFNAGMQITGTEYAINFTASAGSLAVGCFLIAVDETSFQTKHPVLCKQFEGFLLLGLTVLSIYAKIFASSYNIGLADLTNLSLWTWASCLLMIASFCSWALEDEPSLIPSEPST